MEDVEVLKKWEEMGFLENISESLKTPLSKEYERLFLFIKDLDDNKRFNHDDLQELMDIGVALVYDVVSETPNHTINTDYLYKIFFNTKLKDFESNVLSEKYGEYPVYLLIRNFIIPDNGDKINLELNTNVEYLLTDLVTKYYKEKML